MLDDNIDIYKALERVAKSGLLNRDVEDMVQLALAFWHEGFVPDIDRLKKMDSNSLLVVGYIAEFLAGFNVLCNEEREKLLEFSKGLKPNTPQFVKPDEFRDELASEWGLEHDLTPYFEYISHYQTRHYNHNSSYKRPSENFIL